MRAHSVARLSRAILFLLLASLIGNSATPLLRAENRQASSKQSLSKRDEAFLEDLSRRSFRYFWEQADPRTGLVLDRARTDGSIHNEAHRNIASIAAAGFGLTALCIGAERGWVKRKDARDRVRSSLRFFAKRAPVFTAPRKMEHGKNSDE